MSNLWQKADDREQAKAFAWPLQSRQSIPKVSKFAVGQDARRWSHDDLHFLH